MQSVLLGLLLVGVVVGTMVFSTTLPIVKFSYATGDCVEVESENNQYNCENLPKKYHHEWVK